MDWVKPSLYALYRGDEFLDVGTKRELAARHHVKPSTIAYMATGAHRRRCAGHEDTRVMAYRIDDEEGDDRADGR